MPGIAGIVLTILTLVQQGVVTAQQASALVEQGRDEAWSRTQWRAKLTELAQTSDEMFAATQAMLQQIAIGTPEEEAAPVFLPEPPAVPA